MKQEKSQNPTIKGSKEKSKSFIEDFTADELKSMPRETESKIWGETFVRNLNAEHSNKDN